jgi:hypothetical protein
MIFAVTDQQQLAVCADPAARQTQSGQCAPPTFAFFGLPRPYELPRRL